MSRTNCEKLTARGIELLAVTVLSACATVPQTEPVALPVTLQSSFGSCQGRDGAANLTMETSEGPLRADAEWVSRSTGSWDLELTNSMGQPLLLLRYKKDAGRFALSGRVAERIPQLDVDEDGFVTVGGYFLGVRPEELPCFLSYVLPSAWLDHAYDYRQQENALQFQSYDKKRGIEIEARHISQPKERELCARISWSSHLGVVRRQGSLCFRGEIKKTATLQGFDGLDIRWWPAEGAHE